MFKFNFEYKGIVTIILAILIFIIAAAISWGFTCGIVYLICKCFGWEWFTLLKATGIWLALVLISGIAGTAKPR